MNVRILIISVDWACAKTPLVAIPVSVMKELNPETLMNLLFVLVCSVIKSWPHSGLVNKTAFYRHY